MAVFARSRRLTEPFNEKVRERIFGFGSRISNASSGSDHDADTDLFSSIPSSSSSTSTCSASPCLSYLVQNFLENADASGSTGAGDPSSSAKDAAESENNYLVSDPTALIRDVINPIVRTNCDQFRSDLLVHVSRAEEAFALFRENHHSAFTRNVMAYLREIGYNAGVCKTKWEATPGGGLSAGKYEFIDVVRSSPSPVSFSQDPDSRYIIDLNFSGQFEIARETECYRRLLSALPRVFVGKSDDMKRIVKLMADETRRSMKINGMSLPPWRKNRYMQAKWFGAYKRTVNQLPISSQQAEMSVSAVKCSRSVGFFASAVDVGRLAVAPPTTRTR